MSKRSLVIRLLAVGFLLPSVFACGSANQTEPLTVTDAAGQKRYTPDDEGHVKALAQADRRHFAVSVAWDLHARQAVLHFYDGGAPAMQVSDVRVRLSMPEHGHDGVGVPKAVVLAPATPWLWDVSELAPSMSGDWQLRVEATVRGQADRATVLFHFPAVTGEHVGARHH